MTGEEPDFHRFLERFRFLRRFYHTQEAVERVASEAVADAADDNVKYLELRFNPVALARAQGFPLEAVTRWVCGAVARAQDGQDIRVNLIIQIGRDETVETAGKLAQVAVDHRDHGVVALDLAGDEEAYPMPPFGEIFREARRDGLHVTVHAGEVGAPRNIEQAIKNLKAERIGHGVRCVGDPGTIALIQEREVTLEVCPTSNVQTGAVRDFWRHPLPNLLALNVPVCINTDDPSVSDTTLTDEYWVAVSAMRIRFEQIKKTIVTAAEASFQPTADRRRMTTWFREQLQMNGQTSTGADTKAHRVDRRV